MSEQEQAPVEGTPENAGTAQEAPGTPAEVVDYQKRYDDMRPEFDRRGSRVAELERYEQSVNDLKSDDADTRARAAQALGLPFEFVDETPEDPYTDPSEQLTARLEALEQQLQQQAQQGQQAQQIAQIEQHVEKELTALDGLDESDREWIVNTAVAMPPTADGMPDIKGAHEKFTAWETARQQKWAQTKKAPRIGQVGTAGTQALPEDAGHNERVAYAMERLQADQ
jgi:transcriptional regulator with XRE-family HTH domain